ncbi:MAG: SH3 domain-containing protein [Tissierellia bacterium]|nr:SH3 domain-containing protein [Tissierellia bacterium]
MKKLFKYTLASLLVLPATLAFNSIESEAASATVNPNLATEVNVRSEASEDSQILGTVNTGDSLEVLSNEGAWLKVNYNGEDAYVGSYWFNIDNLDEVALISAANFRQEPSLDSNVIETLEQGTVVKVLDYAGGGFYKVSYNETEGYISYDLLNLPIPQVNYAPVEANYDYSYDNSSADYSYDYNNGYDYSYNDNSYNYDYNYNQTSNYSNAASSSYNGSDVYSYASQYVGNPYVWGGNSLTGGTDCSGFTQSVYSNYGVSLPHNAQAQYGYGTNVNYNDVQSGDLVFYGSSSSNITHVAIADGNGGIVHAANESSGITTGSLGNPVGIKRVK